MERFNKSWVFHGPTDVLIERFNLLIQELKMTERMPDEEALMVAQPMIGYRSRDLRDLPRAFFLARSAICSAVI